MTTRHHIRPATEEDFDSLFELHCALFRPHIEAIWGWDLAWQQSQFRREFESSETLVVEIEARTVGYFQVIVETDLLYLRNIALHSDVQGQGIGTRLVQRLQQRAANLGVPIRLSIFAANSRAESFYRRLGFRRTGSETVTIGMSWEDSPDV